MTRYRREESSEFCAFCGCTEAVACEEGCSWVEAGLCSSCATNNGSHRPRLQMFEVRLAGTDGWVVFPTLADYFLGMGYLLSPNREPQRTYPTWLSGGIFVELKPVALTAEEYYSLPIGV